MADRFADKTVVVTGGTSGIGRALCVALAGEGAVVVVAGRNMDRANEIVAEIANRGGRAQAEQVDVTSEADVVGLVERMIETHGRLDYMFNNAGVGVLGEARDLETEHWRPSIDVNLWGVIHGTSAAYKAMVKQGGGHIINVSSIQGIVPFAWSTPYVASKHAVYGYSMALRAEGADLGVKVSVVCPEGVESELVANTPMVNLSRDTVDVIAESFGMMPVERAVHLILRGVARNRAVIVFPANARWLWRFYRISPPLWIWLGTKILRRFRRRAAELRTKG